ncbi:hypothetical protein SAMN02745751_01150 [Dethiosulfatibacter aminovorans DSM 17477]|uniref:Uncharacterized protein n=1 Tax=Dethiosulfatibacter aminovorans DSM 17477 TaxID=1121476 RepID=A0A1M6ECB8_9FIRM|nr:hypothetical protein [Dethiosulfatibacter aminovorans]SHI83157.1 hypothetical protein SAMN02745751_01150 [Dethiosulfatibacter aminovorans DSM 17477]
MRKNWIIALTILIICLISIPAFGNAASPYERPDSNVVLFDDDTGIVLREEWVKFTIDENNWNSRVDVIYDIENEDRDDHHLDIMFIAPYFDYDTGEVYVDRFEAVVDGNEITEFEIKEEDDIPVNWNARYTMEIMDPVDDRMLERRLSDGGPASKGGKVEGIQFSIDIEKGQRKTLEISYKAEEGYYSFDDVVNDVYTHLYYLTPAEFWNGDPVVNLEIEFPNGGYEVHSSIDLDQVSDTIYSARLEGLPDEEWTFSYVDTTGLFYGTNRRSIHNVITWGIITATVLAGIYVRKRKKWKGNLVLLLILPELFLFRPGYGILYLVYFLFAPVTALVLFIILVMMALRQYNKRKRDRRL